MLCCACANPSEPSTPSETVRRSSLFLPERTKHDFGGIRDVKSCQRFLSISIPFVQLYVLPHTLILFAPPRPTPIYLQPRGAFPPYLVSIRAYMWATTRYLLKLLTCTCRSVFRLFRFVCMCRFGEIPRSAEDPGCRGIPAAAERLRRGCNLLREQTGSHRPRSGVLIAWTLVGDM